MPMLVNRRPVDDDTLAALKEHCETPPHSNISRADLDEAGRRILRTQKVEGEPADGVTLHGTRWGRRWCAYRAVE